MEISCLYIIDLRDPVNLYLLVFGSNQAKSPQPGYKVRQRWLVRIVIDVEVPVEPNISGMLDQAGVKILLIEDAPMVRTMVGAILTRRGYHCVEATTGRDALTEAPALIILDRGLPDITDINGLQVVEQLRDHLMTRQIPIIMLTLRSSTEDVVIGLGAGPDDYIVKPFESAELAARIESGLRRSSRDLGADPLTKLPGNALLRQELADRVTTGASVAVILQT